MQPTFGGDADVVLAVIDASLTGPGALAYSTYLGGGGSDVAYEVRWLADGSLVLTGQVSAPGFPTTPEAFQPLHALGSSEGFVTRIQPGVPGPAALITSTYFGGAGFDALVSLEVLEGSIVAVVGNSDDDSALFTTPDAFVGSFPSAPAFANSAILQVFDLDAIGSDQLLFSTYLTGPGGSASWGLGARDGLIAITGWTDADDYLVANPFAQAVNSDGVILSLIGTPTFVSSAPSFRRGEVNHDGAVNIADAIASLNILFAGAQNLCSDAADANDDGVLNIADPIYLLAVLFGGSGQVFAAPFPDCGSDLTLDALDCMNSPACP